VEWTSDTRTLPYGLRPAILSPGQSRNPWADLLLSLSHSQIIAALTTCTKKLAQDAPFLSSFLVSTIHLGDSTPIFISHLLGNSLCATDALSTHENASSLSAVAALPPWCRGSEEGRRWRARARSSLPRQRN